MGRIQTGCVLRPTSNPLRVGGAGEESSSPDQRAVLPKQRPNSQQYTLWFDGPRALDAFRACQEALSPCSYKVVVIGSHTKVSFDAIYGKRVNVRNKGGIAHG